MVGPSEPVHPRSSSFPLLRCSDSFLRPGLLSSPLPLRDAVVQSWVDFQSGLRPVVRHGVHVCVDVFLVAHVVDVRVGLTSGKKHLERCAQRSLSLRDGGDVPLRNDAGSQSADVGMVYFFFWSGTDPELWGLHGRQGRLRARRLDALLWPVPPSRLDESFFSSFALHLSQTLLSPMTTHRQTGRSFWQ